MHLKGYVQAYMRVTKARDTSQHETVISTHLYWTLAYKYNPA